MNKSLIYYLIGAVAVYGAWRFYNMKHVTSTPTGDAFSDNEKDWDEVIKRSPNPGNPMGIIIAGKKGSKYYKRHSVECIKQDCPDIMVEITKAQYDALKGSV